MLGDLCCFIAAKCEPFSILVEVLTHYSKQARHYLKQYEALQTALNNQPADTTPTPSAVAPPTPRQRYRLIDRLGEATLQEITERYIAGVSLTELAMVYGVARSSLGRHMKRHGIAIRQQGLTDDQKRDILRLRAQGIGIRTIAKRLGCAYGTTRLFVVDAETRNK